MVSGSAQRLPREGGEQAFDEGAFAGGVGIERGHGGLRIGGTNGVVDQRGGGTGCGREATDGSTGLRGA